MRADIVEALDTIDAACFTGDLLQTEEGVVNLKQFVERWGRAIREAENATKNFEAPVVVEIREFVAYQTKKRGEKPPLIFVSPALFAELEAWAIANLHHTDTGEKSFERSGPELDGVKIRRSANPFVRIGALS